MSRIYYVFIVMLAGVAQAMASDVMEDPSPEARRMAVIVEQAIHNVGEAVEQAAQDIVQAVEEDPEIQGMRQDFFEVRDGAVQAAQNAVVAAQTDAGVQQVRQDLFRLRDGVRGLFRK